MKVFTKALTFFVAFSLICGILYTGVVTALAQVIFPRQANGSIIEVDGKKYGTELLGQYYNDENHMWGRIMSLDLGTFTDEEGNYLMYSAPTNMSPASDDMEAAVAERVEMIRAAHPEMDQKAVPVELVTCSGSGLDPHISVAAATWQVSRLAANNDMSEDEVLNIIEACTDHKLMGVLGEDVVNVLKVNLMLDGILEP